MALHPPASWDAHGRDVPALLARRAAQAVSPVFLHLQDDRGAETPLTHAQLLAAAQAAAGAFQAQGVRPGDRVMIGLPTGLDFLAAFFGAMLAGATAVPFYPPARAKGLDAYQRQLAGLIQKAQPRLIITAARARLAVEAAAFQAGVAAPVREPLAGGAFTPVALDPDAPALIQFTSGSTQAPKGVVLTHRQLLANLAALAAVVPCQPGEAVVSWLPLYHDMGLIGMMLLPLWLDLQLVLMPPTAFLLDAKRWLHAISRHRAVISTAPNFAYQLVANRLQDPELAGLDLSSWRVAYTGAEPCLPATHAAFAARLQPWGFDAAAFRPIYGLAEMAVGVAFAPADAVDAVDAAALEAEGVARPGTDRGYAALGPPLPGYRIRIAGQTEERRVGEVELDGPSRMLGYLDDPQATAAALTPDGWLRTGDLGYLAGGQLHLVGRAKDMILKGGRNYAPQDLEALAMQVAGVRSGGVVAFGVPDAASGTERVVVLAETREPPAAWAALARAIAQDVAMGLGLQPDEVVMVGPGHLPKTSSGKPRRAQARADWLAGDLRAPVEPGVWDLTRTIGQALVQRTKGALHG